MRNLILRLFILATATVIFPGLALAESLVYTGDPGQPVWLGDDGEVPTGIQCPAGTAPGVWGTSAYINGGRPSQDNLDLRRAQAVAPPSWNGTWYFVPRTTVPGNKAAAAWCVKTTSATASFATLEEWYSARNAPDMSKAWILPIAALAGNCAGGHVIIHKTGNRIPEVHPNASPTPITRTAAGVFTNPNLQVPGSNRFSGIVSCPKPGSTNTVWDGKWGEDGTPACRKPTDRGEEIAAFFGEKSPRFDDVDMGILLFNITSFGGTMIDGRDALSGSDYWMVTFPYICIEPEAEKSSAGSGKITPYIGAAVDVWGITAAPLTLHVGVTGSPGDHGMWFAEGGAGYDPLPEQRRLAVSLQGGGGGRWDFGSTTLTFGPSAQVGWEPKTSSGDGIVAINGLGRATIGNCRVQGVVAAGGGVVWGYGDRRVDGASAINGGVNVTLGSCK